MLLRCPSCDSPIKPEDVSFELHMAKCRACEHVFMLEGDAAPAPPAKPRPASLVARPEGVEEVTWGGQTTISWRWWTPIALFLVMFCTVWDGFLVMWYGMALGMDAPSMFIFFPLIHVAVGIGLSWYTIALFVNRTRVTIGGGEVRVHHGPLYWPGSRTLGLRGFSGTEVLERDNRTSSSRGSSGTVTWDVHVITSGVSHPLVTGLPAEHARWLASRVDALAR
jgi:hypothetical protein